MQYHCTQQSGTARWGQQGQTLVEFALVILLLFLLLFGIIDFARLFFGYATMANGVREGARYGITHPGDDADIEAHARDMMVLIGADATITILYPGQDNGSNPGCTTPHMCSIQVQASSNFNMWTPIIPSLPIVTQATMHFE